MRSWNAASCTTQGLHLVMKLNLLPRISIRKKNVPSNTNTFGTSAPKLAPYGVTVDEVIHLQAMALRILYLTLFRHTHLHHLDRQLAARQSHGRAAEELVVLDGDATTFDPSPHTHDSM